MTKRLTSADSVRFILYTGKMKLAFIPGRLFLESRADGTFELRFGEESQILRSQSAALRMFNELRKKLEQEHPPHNLSTEERRKILERYIADYLGQRNYFKDHNR